MTKIDQPSLFPDVQPPDEVSPQQPIDLAEVARHIGRTARPVEYIDRTSDAARDQGHGPIELPTTEQGVDDVEVVPIAIEKSRRNHPSAWLPKATEAKVIELPSRTRGTNAPKVKFSPTRASTAAFERSKAQREELRRQLRDKDQR